MSKSDNLTPLMRQYFEIKEQYSDYLLLFQVGDFYELFFEDAKKASSFLGIALTKRGNINGEPIPLCGVPMHALDHYLIKLVRGGFKVAICNQLEEATPGKVVRRGITQVLTPGTLTDSRLLDDKSASYLLSFFPSKNGWGLLFGELLTAQLFATTIQPNAIKSLESELARFFPDEILIPDTKEGKYFGRYFKDLGFFSTEVQEIDNEDEQSARAWLNRQLHEQSDYFNEHEDLKLAVYNFYNYLHKNQEAALYQFRQVQFYKPDDFLILDAATQKNLELIKNNQDGTKSNTLFSLLDRATTSMGSRMIKKWIMRPLVKQEQIVQRQDAIEILIKDLTLREKLISLFYEISDLERTIGRIALNRAQLGDYLNLKSALTVLPELKKILRKIQKGLFAVIETKITDFSNLTKLLEDSLNDDLSRSYLIKPGFDKELDRIRELVDTANEKILKLEQKEQELTGITSLKIRYNQVQGYYIEVTKPNLDAVPKDRYIRHQTLSGKERFITQELKDLQVEIEYAHSQISTAEAAIFDRIKYEVSQHVGELRRVAHTLAHLDALIGFANIAYDNGYVRPMFNANRDIIIEDGRHPIVEVVSKNSFIPNDTNLTDDESLWIITGPNMGGKSTYLRQVALICIMAQCGSFIPAKSASLPILDRIFTRIGAGDNLAEGKSTFLVEMEETASICTQATENSLVILDEVGRGTSTFDGLAIAQAVVEYIYKNIKARCLFATHYHELTSLESKYPGICAYHAASKKTNDGILFLHKIAKGVANGSFGIEVAKLANLPKSVVQRAQEILVQLQDGKINNNSVSSQLFSSAMQIQIQELESELEENKKIVSKFKNIDFNNLSPKQAFDLLWEIKEGLDNP